MQKILLILLIISLFSCGNVRKNDTQATKPTDTFTTIEFEEEIHNFGELLSGEIVVFTYIFKNTGDADLMLKNVYTDCGCLNENHSTGKIKPGESGKIEIEFDTAGLFGKQFKSIEVEANTKETKQLAIFAEIKNEQIEIKN